MKLIGDSPLPEPLWIFERWVWRALRSICSAFLGLYGVLATVAGPLVLVLAGLSWLSDAKWPDWRFSLAYDLLFSVRPATRMLGLQKIIDWIFELPLGVGLVITGLIALYLANRLMPKAGALNTKPASQFDE